MVDVLSLNIFKARSDRALSNLIYLKMSFLVAGGLDKMTFTGPFQPRFLKDNNFSV